MIKKFQIFVCLFQFLRLQNTRKRELVKWLFQKVNGKPAAKQALIDCLYLLKTQCRLKIENKQFLRSNAMSTEVLCPKPQRPLK